MEVLPSIDLRSGQVVRLAQGDYDRQTVYGDDPVSVVDAFLAAGARWIHVVDLDAARSGVPTNTDAVRSICAAAGGAARVEFGGGIRDDATIDLMLEAGVSRMVIGSAAMKNWPWFEGLLAGDRVASGSLALGLDARGAVLAAEGWAEPISQTPTELAERVRGSQLGAIVYTDIELDGMLAGPNFSATADLVAITDVPIVASGGVSSVEDVARCREIGCGGAIIGRAYYEGRIDLPAAVRAARCQD